MRQGYTKLSQGAERLSQARAGIQRRAKGSQRGKALPETCGTIYSVPLFKFTPQEMTGLPVQMFAQGNVRNAVPPSSRDVDGQGKEARSKHSVSAAPISTNEKQAECTADWTFV